MEVMKRRDFIKSGSAAVLGTSLSNSLIALPYFSMGDRDIYGGWEGKKFNATGYFRLEKDERWWLVSPEGNAFLSFGINHLHTDWWHQSYNSEVWANRFNLSDGYTFEEFRLGLRNWFHEECDRVGFNTASVHTDLTTLNTPVSIMPYVRPIHFVDIPHWKDEIPDTNFVDVFSEEYAQHCDRMAKEFAGPLKDDPFLLAYTMTDCPLFTEEDCRERDDVIGGDRRKSRIGWPRRLRNFGADAPGKQTYVIKMRELYKDEINEFNNTYGTTFGSFYELAEAREWRPGTDLSNGFETRDNIEFLKIIVAKYYEIARDSIYRYDPNHMFFGDKLNANTDTVDTVLPVTEKYTDLVMYQMYAKYEVQESKLDRWAKVTKKPFINGDSSYSVPTEYMPRPYGPHADDQEQRAQWTKEFFEKAFARPDFVGWHYCGLIDAPNMMKGRLGRQHAGILNTDGIPYQPIYKVLTELSEKLYELAIRGV